MIDRQTMAMIAADTLDKSQADLVAKVKTIAIPDPAAGQELSYTVPSGVMLVILGFFAQLTTDATVATRRPSLDATDGSRQFMTIPHPLTVTANGTAYYGWLSELSTVTSGAGVRRGGPLAPIILLPSWTIATVTFSMQAGDQWKNCTIYCIEWS